MVKRIFAWLISASLIISGGFVGYAAEKQTSLTLDMAMTLCLKKDVELSVLQNQWRTKTAELKVLKAVTPLWVEDLLIYAAPQKAEMAVRQRAEAIQKEQINLERQYKNRAFKLLNDTRQQYYELLIQEATATYAYERIQSLQSSYAVLYPAYLKGQVSLDSLDQNRTLYKETSQTFDTASGSAITLRSALTLQIGDPILGSAKLEIPRLQEALTLDDILIKRLQQQAAIQANSVREAMSASLDAERDLNDLVKLYEIVYLQSAQGLKQALDMPLRPYEAVFDAYLRMTNTSGAGLLVKAENPKVFPVVQGFNVHQLPLESFSPMPSPLSYWQQPPSPINSALVAADLRQHELNVAKDNLNKELLASYNSAQLTWIKQTELESSLKASEAMLEKLKKANWIGVSKYEDVLLMQDTVNRMRLEVLKNKLTLMGQLSQLEYLSGGALGLLLADNTLGDIARINKLFDMPVQTMPNYGSAYWTVKNDEAGTNFIFNLNLPEKTNLTQYQLFSPEGKSLSKPLPIKSACVHEVFVYKENTSLTLVLYEKEKVKYTFKLPIDAIAGKLKL